jgi:hypothetical protein
MSGDIERLALVQGQVIKLRRLAAETFDREITPRLLALADEIEHRAREADRLRCSPKSKRI